MHGLEAGYDTAACMISALCNTRRSSKGQSIGLIAKTRSGIACAGESKGSVSPVEERPQCLTSCADDAEGSAGDPAAECQYPQVPRKGNPFTGGDVKQNQRLKHLCGPVNAA